MVCVLISCMNQSDTGIIKRSRIETDVVVVNQCNEDSVNEFDFENAKGKKCHVKFINTTGRGLSRSRNMAIANARSGSICLLCDDDEVLEDGYEDKILEGYSLYSDAGVIAYSLNWNGFGKKYAMKSHRLSFKQTLGVCSVQITFKVDYIREKSIRFDEMLGSGTGNGAGEENKFMLDCRKAKFSMYYHPNCIATVNTGESMWFKGYTEKYFRNVGWASRRVYENGVLTIAMICYYGFVKYKLYKTEMSYFQAMKYMLQGYNEKR